MSGAESTDRTQPQYEAHKDGHGSLFVYGIRCRLTTIDEDPDQRKMWVSAKLLYSMPDGWVYNLEWDDGKWMLWDGKTQPPITWGRRFGTPFTGAGRVASIVHDIECARSNKLGADGFVAEADLVRRRADEMYYHICVLLGKKPRSSKWIKRGIRAAAILAHRRWVKSGRDALRQ